MDIIEGLQNKNDSEAYILQLKLEKESTESNKYYSYFNDFLKLLDSKSSFVRTRGFRLICSQAKWDKENKIENNIDLILQILDDEKPIAVRQSLAALHTAILYKPDLCLAIEEKLNTLNISKYKDSMSPLIQKDIAELRGVM